jgi:AMP nucleosidase
MAGHGGARNLKEFTDPDAAIARVRHIYDTGVELVRARFARFVAGVRGPDAAPIEAYYPYLGLSVRADQLSTSGRPPHGAVPDPGTYGSTLTRPDIFGDYLREQIADLMRNHKVPVVVGVSDRPIALPFVIEHATADISAEDVRALQGIFALPDLAWVEDGIANGTYRPRAGEPLPLALFNAERVDLALNRLHHYTGTSEQHFQRFVLFTNYQRYVEEFVAFGRAAAGQDDYLSFVEPGDAITTATGKDKGATPPFAPQMPAYHLTRAGREGITLVNIGVGPSNAKTITDHLAVLRPHCWIMMGHCGGLRRSQLLGDYVLAHAYIREDHVLDQDLPAWVPVPPIAEIQVALQQAVERVSGLHGAELKLRMRTGTVATTDNRNWELRFSELYERFSQSRAIAIDMESATIAANGFRLRVPYGTLLCVSDKPLHGEVKLRGMANAFYRERISQHLKIGLETIRILREGGVEQLQSRKLRSFREPPFR